ncbi:hypothetical protein ABIE58_003760 [Roseovarius sp. MBR-78]|jgi:hypothetical protein|uniref:hypothetical protein n=1 Tax=Roseovarius sp. MBR-78 TaxID=3156460 RepID=UPI003396771F
MDYKVRITVGRYRRARDFLSDLAQLKTFRGEYAGPALLESLEELELLRPRIRLSWPAPIARLLQKFSPFRFWGIERVALRVDALEAGILKSIPKGNAARIAAVPDGKSGGHFDVAS